MQSVITVCTAVALTAAFALPASAERLNDKQAKAAVENIDRGFDTWKDSLERRNLDDAVLRSASGTIEIRRFLDDFEKEIHQVKDRLKPDYAANPEVTSLLRRASDVERRAQAGQAAPEWKAMSSQFSALASAYGTTFPMPSASAEASRLTDNELAKYLEDMERQAKQVSSEADKAMKAAKATDAERNTMKQTMNALAASAKQTRSMIKSGTASPAQATALLSAASAAKGVVGGLPMAGPGKTAWSSIDRGAAALAKAFGTSW